MPAVGAVASVLGIKCVNIFSCACCIYCFEEEGMVAQLVKRAKRKVGRLWQTLANCFPHV